MAQPPNFDLLLTDGDPNHLPSASEREKDYKTTDDYGLTQKALSNFATEMMRLHKTKIEKGESEKHCSSATLPAIPDGMSSGIELRVPFLCDLGLVCWPWLLTLQCADFDEVVESKSPTAVTTASPLCSI